MNNVATATRKCAKPSKGNNQGANGGNKQRVVPYVPGLKIKYLVPDPFGTGDGFETMAPNQTEGQSLFGNAFSNN